MGMLIENVKTNLEGKERLSRLKKFTGVETRNVLCRWALCRSFADPSVPPKIDNKGEFGVEIPWKIFGGEYREIYLALLKQRCRNDGFELDAETLTEQLWLHLNRGLGYLSSEKRLKEIYDSGRRSVRGLLELSEEASRAA
jgi:DNA sulfur modification protein DndE